MTNTLLSSIGFWKWTSAFGIISAIYLWAALVQARYRWNNFERQRRKILKERKLFLDQLIPESMNIISVCTELERLSFGKEKICIKQLKNDFLNQACGLKKMAVLKKVLYLFAQQFQNQAAFKEAAEALTRAIELAKIDTIVDPDHDTAIRKYIRREVERMEKILADAKRP